MTNQIILAAALALAIPAAPVAAATLDEGALRGGDFSDFFDRPTAIGADVRTVIGGQRHPDAIPGGTVQTVLGRPRPSAARPLDADYLMFEGFAPGTERLDFRITNPMGDWGGFNLRVKSAPFANAGDWWPLVAHEEVTKVTDGAPQTFSLDLAGITGPLYLVFDFFDADFTSGDGVRYEITQVDGSGLRDSEIMPSAIPLPPAGMLLLAGLGGLGLMGARKRRG